MVVHGSVLYDNTNDVYGGGDTSSHTGNIGLPPAFLDYRLHFLTPKSYVLCVSKYGKSSIHFV